jgi:hypothetical protein
MSTLRLLILAAAAAGVEAAADPASLGHSMVNINIAPRSSFFKSSFVCLGGLTQMLTDPLFRSAHTYTDRPPSNTWEDGSVNDDDSIEQDAATPRRWSGISSDTVHTCGWVSV